MKFSAVVCLPVLCLICMGCSRNHKQAYTSETYYEKKARWILPDKYLEVIVAIPIEDKVEPAFLVTRQLYQKQGRKYVEAKVRTVDLEVYEAAEKRRQQLLDNLFNFFRILAIVGAVACVAGLLLFVMQFKFPVIAGIWDEFLLYGGVLGSVGVFGAWYVEQLVVVGIVAGAVLIAAAIYSAVKQYRKNRVIAVQGSAVTDLVETVEVYKGEAAESWETVKTKIKQLPTTSDMVAKAKPAIKLKLGTAHAIP